MVIALLQTNKEKRWKSFTWETKPTETEEPYALSAAISDPALPFRAPFLFLKENRYT